MSLPEIVTREEWLNARKRLLTKEKELTRARDALAAERRMLPMVRVGKKYRFEGPEGTVELGDLFDGQRQLVLQHFMFDPSWDAGCGGCTAAVDEISDGLLTHLRARDTNYAIVARAPLGKLDAYRAERGWKIPFYSSFNSDFNYDFHVTFDESVAPVLFNYRGPQELKAAGLEWILDAKDQPMEQPGMSFFLREGSEIFHTYSTFARGTEQGGTAYALLDMTALGRQEEWEEPKGRAVQAKPNAPTFQ